MPHIGSQSPGEDLGRLRRRLPADGDAPDEREVDRAVRQDHRILRERLIAKNENRKLIAGMNDGLEPLAKRRARSDDREHGEQQSRGDVAHTPIL